MGQEITKPGEPVIKICVECKQNFTTYRGQVSIKGPVPEMTKCTDCRAEDLRRLEPIIKAAFTEIEHDPK